MKKKSILIIGSLLLFLCTGDEFPLTVTWFGEMRIFDEVSGWVDQPAKFITFDVAGLYDLIDSGAVTYEEQGMVDGLFQTLLKGTDTTCDASAYNFRTAQNSIAMFTLQTENITDSNKVLIAGFDDSIAVGNRNPLDGSAVIYAHFRQFELEILFKGHSNIESLKTDAAKFLQVYETKIGE